MAKNDEDARNPSDIQFRTVNIIHSTFATTHARIDDEKMQEALRVMGEAVQKRMDAEIFNACAIPSGILNQSAQPSIRVETERWQGLLLEKHSIFDSMLRYKLNYGGYSAHRRPKKITRTTKRKDGREQQTCDCGCCPFPHRAGSIEGCKS